MTAACGHLGRIEAHLPCPDPACAHTSPGQRLVVPHTRVRVLREGIQGGYWQWDGPVLRRHEIHPGRY
jgi:hypothetical protein